MVAAFANFLETQLSFARVEISAAMRKPVDSEKTS
jgi:hypothetical protein